MFRGAYAGDDEAGPTAIFIAATVGQCGISRQSGAGILGVELIRTLVVALCAALCAPIAASAQPLFDNPFQEAAQYRRERGGATPATLRLRYEKTTLQKGVVSPGEVLVIDVAPDWARLSGGGRDSLFDFKLNRVFTLASDRFESANAAALPLVRVFERQNRMVMARIVKGTPGEVGACDADTELATILGQAAVTPRLSERDGTMTYSCDGHTIGSFRPSTSSPPAAFWPVMNLVMPSHPELFRRARAGGKAPASLDSEFSRAGPDRVRVTWRLVGAEVVDVPYPLTDTMRNATADLLNRTVASGVGTVAADAVAGRAQGGAPTPEIWSRTLRTLFDKDGPVPIAMALLPTANMFPQSVDRCAQGARDQICQAIGTGQSVIQSDPAPRALFTITEAEQSGNASAALEAMRAAQATPYKDHPALGAAYALATLKFDKATRERAQAAGLPTDVKAMQVAAVKAYPYTPAYWFDLAGQYSSGYDFQTSLLLYDVALSLPMPEALNGGPLPNGARQMVGRIRKDFPDAFLPPGP